MSVDRPGLDNAEKRSSIPNSVEFVVVVFSTFTTAFLVSEGTFGG